MLKKTLNSLMILLICLLSSVAQAYDQKSCMQEINITVSNESVPELLDRRQKLLQENADNYVNDKNKNSIDLLVNQATVLQLVNEARLVEQVMNAVLISTTLRQAGVFKSSRNLDLLLDTQFQSAFESVKFAQDAFTRNVNTLSRPLLREKALAVSQQLEKISSVIRSCEK